MATTTFIGICKTKNEDFGAPWSFHISQDQ
ncbi:hypothetical protein I3760_04G125500 [Carya illinoinensis]|nr:hypothetical protein I3760_04G125500 [Carya illinoinensis]